jgi:hypothetical protein
MNTKPYRTPVDSDTTQQSIDTISHTHYGTPTIQGTSSGTVATVGDSARQVGAQEDVQAVINTLRVKRKRFTIGLSVIAVLIVPLALVLATLMKNGTEAFAFSVLFMMSLGLLTSVLWFRHSGLSEEIAELKSRVNPKGDS